MGFPGRFRGLLEPFKGVPRVSGVFQVKDGDYKGVSTEMWRFQWRFEEF